MWLALPGKFYYKYLECKYFKFDHLDILSYFLINIYHAPVIVKGLSYRYYLLYTLL